MTINDSVKGYAQADNLGPINGASTNGSNGVSHLDNLSIENNYTNGLGHANGATRGLTNGDHKTALNTSSEPIAIVGMAMRLPGGIKDASDFWNLLIEKRDGRVRVPGDRYNVEAFYNETGKPGTVRTQYGNFLQDNLKHLDVSFFSMTRSETEKLDPQARLLLEVSREVLENAGETQWQGKNIGCYVGVFGEDWQDIHLKDSQDAGMYRVTGYGDVSLPLIC